MGVNLWIMKKILIDCDPGIDDSLAIILALKSSKVKLEAITTVSGNLHVDDTSTNSLKILEFMNATEIPVAKGMAKPLVRDLPVDPFSHGDDGLGNTGFPLPKTGLFSKFGPELIVEIINVNPKEITLVATGPLTNIAMALLMDPGIINRVKEIILIGGSYGFTKYAYINATGSNPVSEWNIYVDPEAAKLVFNSGMPIKAIGLDVATHPNINFRQENIEKLKRSNNKEAKYVCKLVEFADKHGFESYSVLIDSLAVAAAIDSDIIKTTAVHVGIETKGELTLGQTVLDIRRRFRWDDMPLINVAYDADYDSFLDLVTNELIKK